MNRIIKRIIMATASLNIRLSYNQILELARQLTDEDKLQLNRELSAEVRKIELQRLLQVFKNDEISLEEISSEVELVRQASTFLWITNSAFSTISSKYSITMVLDVDSIV